MEPPAPSASGLDGGDLDKDLLAALDEMLSFSGTCDAFTDTMLELGDIPPPLSPLAQQPEAPVQKNAAPPSPLTDQHRRGKDARSAPYDKPKPRRRKRPKDELDYLRAQVAALQDELAKLSSAGESDGATTRDDELFVQWKRIADRQKAETDRSMVENLKLRSILEGQLKVARSLEAAIQQQQQTTTQLLTWHRSHGELEANEGTRRPRATSVSDELIFAQLNVGLEAQYAEFDSVIDRRRLAQVLQNSIGIETLHDAGEIAFRHEEARLLPFSMPAVHRALWSCVRYGKAKELAGRIRTKVVNNDHLNVQILDRLQLPGSVNVNVCARLAMRRYFEHDRIVIVWSGYVEVAGSLFVRLHEKGFTSASMFDFSNNSLTGGGNSSSSVPGCALRIALQIKPETADFESEEQRQEHIGEVTDLVVGTYHRNFGMMYQLIENLLFNDSTGGEVDDHELARFAAY